MAVPKKSVSSGKTPAKGGQKAVVKAPVKKTAAASKKPVVGAKKPTAIPPKGAATGKMVPKGGSYK
jgi:hypothetical protein